MYRPLRIEPLGPAHLAAAAGLFSEAFARERALTPILDESIGSAEVILPRIRNCLERHPGVAALDDGNLVGYMTGFPLEEFLGPHRGAYSPEWAHASVPENAFGIYMAMYRELGQRWVDDGCITHAVNFLDHSADAMEAFRWCGFGDICIDAVRPVEPIRVKSSSGLDISPLGEDDIPAWLQMIESQSRHMARSPSFLPYLEPDAAESLSSFLRTPGNHAWIARLDGQPVGYMRVTPSGHGAAWVVNGEGKFAINGAYVDPCHRGRGIAGALLSEIMGWGAEGGFTRCSVDFEAGNPEACGFWLKHFKPVCRSMVRRLDPRILKSL